MSVEEIEAAITNLSPEEFARLANWFTEYHWRTWDQEFETDVKAGKLDDLARQAREDFAAGKRRPL